jgi:hypothetical protein
MGAPDLLNHLRVAGLVLTVTPAGRLHVAPREALTDDYRAAIRAERDSLLLALRAEAQATQPNPDRHCWPHTAAMNTAEIELFMRRQAHFVRVGVSDADAERLADAWVTEDREGTNWGCCVACAHLSGFGRLRCSRASAAGVHPELAAEFARVLQRCNAFESHWALENPEISQMISDVPEDQEAWR